MHLEDKIAKILLYFVLLYLDYLFIKVLFQCFYFQYQINL